VWYELLVMLMINNGKNSINNNNIALFVKLLLRCVIAYTTQACSMGIWK